MSSRTIRTERALTLRLIPRPDGDTRAQEEEGTCSKSHGAGGSGGSHLQPPGVAPPGGPGAPGGERALPPRSPRRCPGRPYKGQEKSVPSQGAGPGVASPSDELGWWKEKPGATGLSEKVWSSCGPGSPSAVPRAARPLSARVGLDAVRTLRGPRAVPPPSPPLRNAGRGWGAHIAGGGGGEKRQRLEFGCSPLPAYPADILLVLRSGGHPRRRRTKGLDAGWVGGGGPEPRWDPWPRTRHVWSERLGVRRLKCGWVGGRRNVVRVFSCLLGSGRKASESGAGSDLCALKARSWGRCAGIRCTAASGGGRRPARLLGGFEGFGRCAGQSRPLFRRGGHRAWGRRRAGRARSRGRTPPSRSSAPWKAPRAL